MRDKSTKFYDAVHAYKGRHRRTVERAYDLVPSWIQFHVGKHRRPDFT